MTSRCGCLSAGPGALRGRLVEGGPIDVVFSISASYTRRCCAPCPDWGGRRCAGGCRAFPGSVPDPSSLPAGCAFAPRCGYVMPICREEVPDSSARSARSGQEWLGIAAAACHLRKVTRMSSLSVRDLTKHYPLRGFFGGERGVVGARRRQPRARRTRPWGSSAESAAADHPGPLPPAPGVEPTRGEVVLDGEDLLKRLGARRLQARRRLIQDDLPGTPLVRSIRDSVAHSGGALQIHRLGDTASRRASGPRVARFGGSPGGSDPALPARVLRAANGSASGSPAPSRPDRGSWSRTSPVSALDVSVRAQILRFDRRNSAATRPVDDLRGHDLGVVEQVADRVAVMYLGKIVEEGPCADVLARPLHPYTESLLAAVPPPPGSASPARTAPRGETPDPAAPPPGCPFHPRCPRAQAVCSLDPPALLEHAPGRRAACHFPARSVV